MAKEDRIGALWRTQTTNEKAPLAKGGIRIDGKEYHIVVWLNRWKQEGERTPDFYIELDRAREAQGASGADQGDKLHQDPPQNAPAKRHSETVSRPSADGFSDDIPF